MIRALIIDDSAFTRRTIKTMLESSGRVEVVGVAMDGEQGLRSVAELKPDVITLDLEMPRLDGFAFLRILMRRRPTPVIVVSSYAGREDVLRALELGALDFVAKTSKTASPALNEIKEELVAKVIEASTARLDVYVQDRPMDVTGFITLPEGLLTESEEGDPAAVSPSQRSAPSSPSGPPPPTPKAPAPTVVSAPTGAPKKKDPFSGDRSMTGAYRILTEENIRETAARSSPRVRARTPSSPGVTPIPSLDDYSHEESDFPPGVVVVGASTGGPRAIRKLLGGFDPSFPWPVLLAQHMPARFTTEFANRLRRKLRLEVYEAKDGQRLVPGQFLVAPGGMHLDVELTAAGRVPFLRVRVPSPGDRYIPSADRLFRSASRVFGANVVSVILTGMGNDGAEGVSAVRWAGGRVIAEHESTAVVYGMPREAIATGLVDDVLPLEQISDSIHRAVELMG